MNYKNARKHRINALLWEVQKGRCPRCGQYFTREEMTRDHIIPKSKGGTDRIENLQLMCQPCNQAKANRTDGEAAKWVRRTGPLPGHSAGTSA